MVFCNRGSISMPLLNWTQTQQEFDKEVALGELSTSNLAAQGLSIVSIKCRRQNILLLDSCISYFSLNSNFALNHWGASLACKRTKITEELIVQRKHRNLRQLLPSFKKFLRAQSCFSYRSR